MKGKGSKKSSDKKGLKGLQTISGLLKSLRLQYEEKCKDDQSFAMPGIKQSIKEYEEKCEFLVKVSIHFFNAVTLHYMSLCPMYSFLSNLIIVCLMSCPLRRLSSQSVSAIVSIAQYKICIYQRTLYLGSTHET